MIHPRMKYLYSTGGKTPGPLLSGNCGSRKSENVSPMNRALFATILSLGFAAVTLIGSSQPVRADDYISPDLVKVTTPRYSAAHTRYKPRLGTYEYSVGWEGITAASCTLTVTEQDGKYVIDAAARTYSGVDLLYKLRYEAVGTLSGDDLSPVSLTIDHRENSRHKNIEINFDQDLSSITAVRSKGENDPDKKTVSFTPQNFTLDPIGAAFIARSLEWDVGDSKQFDVFNGKSRYYISLTAVEKTTIDFKGEKRDVIVISPQVRNLTTTKPRSKLREAFIYLSDDEEREILKIESSVFIGSVSVDLESFTPPDSRTPPIELVRAGEDSSARAQMR